MRYVIVHYHILKNAGSTIEEGLDRSFGHRFSRFDLPGRDSIIAPAELLSFAAARPELAAVTSHQVRYPLPEIPGILFFDICFLRDPLDRVRSLYDYYRDKPGGGDPVSALANARDIGGFAAGMVRDFPLAIRNVQVNLIAAAGDSDEPTRDDLELATARMLAASMPGVVDLFDESVRTGEYFLRQVFPELDFSLPAVNVSGGLGSTLESRVARLEAACDPAVFQELVSLNRLDLELLARTRQEIRRRAALVPASSKPAPAPITIPQTRAIFDSAFYLRKYPDVAAARLDPWKHYVRHGASEGRKPNPLWEPGGRHRLFDADSGPGLFDFIRSGAPAVATDAALGIDDATLDIARPAAHQRRFLEAANRGQIRAQIAFQKGSGKG